MNDELKIMIIGATILIILSITIIIFSLVV